MFIAQQNRGRCSYAKSDLGPTFIATTRTATTRIAMARIATTRIAMARIRVHRTGLAAFLKLNRFGIPSASRRTRLCCCDVDRSIF
jgi:hypothetical protein